MQGTQILGKEEEVRGCTPIANFKGARIDNSTFLAFLPVKGTCLPIVSLSPSKEPTSGLGLRFWADEGHQNADAVEHSEGFNAHCPLKLEENILCGHAV